jgi:hypothetical protein
MHGMTVHDPGYENPIRKFKRERARARILSETCRASNRASIIESRPPLPPHYPCRKGGVMETVLL